MLNEIFITTRQSALYSSIWVDNRKLGLKDLSRKWKHFRLGKEKCFFQIFNIKDKKMNVCMCIYIYIYICTHIHTHTFQRHTLFQNSYKTHKNPFLTENTVHVCIYVYIYIFLFIYYISSSACSITVRNTTCYRSLPFLLIVFIYIWFIFSRSIESIYLSNCFKYLFVSSLFFTGHLPTFNTLLFRCAVSFTSLSHWNIRWSTVCVPCLHGHSGHPICIYRKTIRASFL